MKLDEIAATAPGLGGHPLHTRGIEEVLRRLDRPPRVRHGKFIEPGRFKPLGRESSS